MAVNTIQIGAGTLNIGEVGTVKHFAAQVTSAQLTPSVDVSDPVDVLSGEQVAGDRTESFVLEGTMLQDFGTAASLTEWLFTERGTDFDFEFIPNTVKARGVRGILTVEATSIGGDAKTKPTADFSFVVVGVPTLFDAEDALLTP